MGYEAEPRNEYKSQAHFVCRPPKNEAILHFGYGTGVCLLLCRHLRVFGGYQLTPIVRLFVDQGPSPMLRQLANLRRYGRIRSIDPTRRSRKPTFLRANPELEITNVLDFVVAHYGRPQDDFFFVQIGAFDGVTADPLYHLIRKHGWRGVLVEPQREAFELLQKNYAGQPGLQFYDVVIGPHDGEITLYTRTGGTVQAASIDKQRMKKPGQRGRMMDARRVPCWTFDKLLQQANVPDSFDLLQIDAEGCDYEIIHSIDFRRVKPAIIRYEHMVLSQADRNACLKLLAEQGYRFLLEDADTTAYHTDAHAGQALQQDCAA